MGTTNKVLHCRHGNSAAELNQNLVSAGFEPVHLAIFEILDGSDCVSLSSSNFRQQLLKLDLAIVTSQYAVAKLLQHLSDNDLAKLQQTHIVAVGDKTAQQLKRAGFNKVHLPQVNDSDGILALPQVQQSQQAMLFKGEQGRNAIEHAFKLANRKLTTYNIYKRHWQNVTPCQLHAALSCDYFVFTSGEIALQLYQAVKKMNKSVLKQWLDVCTFVPSQRVASKLIQLGATHVINMQGANNLTIIQALQAHKQYDR
ncbi:Uroporphyrinogen-III synthase [Catenovulum agarivorans DS-2]|uniref:Uroporphyrinogen-III synthase n=1 Tax=Catenovulum agarivorans DS-2 TaxID=1328313 RepID=W7QBV0_9ALTE|nr:uroporphyrinogen-III synthase [Catenovulum agarivorans]EWH10334.1 Uroporphyrinogen-III synthase [Catenovulum agarivorans DS-2]